MKIRTLIRITALLMAMTLTGCSYGTNVSSLENQALLVKRITFIMPHMDSSYWKFIADGMQEAAGEYGFDLKLAIPKLNMNIEQMTNLVEEAVASKVDVIVTQGNTDEKFIGVLNKAKENGIIVILVDTDMNDFKSDFYVGTDNYDAGMKIGEAVKKLTNNKARIGIITADEKFPNLKERREAFEKFCAQNSDMEIIAVGNGHYDLVKVVELYENMVEGNQNIDTIVCLEGYGTISLSKALSEEDYSKTRVIGFDFTQDIKRSLEEGIIKGILIQKPYEMGYTCIKSLAQFFETGSFESDHFYTSTIFVTQDSIDKYLEDQ